jgi:N-acyl homoserine lactone hydrolase
MRKKSVFERRQIMRIYGIQTGSFSVKTAHGELRVPALFKLPAIMLDRNFTEPLPILAWVIDHPEGLIVIDTGETAQVLEPGYFRGLTALYFKLNIRYSIRPEDEIGPQMEAQGLSPDEARWVILTHVHPDHTGGLHYFPRAEILMSRTEYERPYAPVKYHWPSWFQPRLIDPGEEGHVLTEAGDVIIVATPGHSAGHLSVILKQSDGPAVFFAGDASFSEAQLLEDKVPGVALDPARTQQTYHHIRSYLRSRPTVYLPSHDPESLQRLAERRITEG